MDSVESCDPFARFKDEAQSLGITAQAKLSEYLQRRAKEECDRNSTMKGQLLKCSYAHVSKKMSRDMRFLHQ